MAGIRSFFTLIRWPNLVFIILTQILFYYCIYQPLYDSNNFRPLLWTITASVTIAAAGYIINDYFDLNIDRINKPGKNVFDEKIGRRWGIFLHLLLSFAGIAATALAAGFSKWYIIVANAGCVALLWLYSTSFKRQLLIGNLVISLLTAWTILVIFFTLTNARNALIATDMQTVKFFRVTFLYAGFAFIISLIREAVKDAEDITGDARYNCKTLPIVAGIRTTKIYIAVWLVVLLATLLILQLYVLQFGWWPAAVYSVLFIILPLVRFCLKLRKAITTGDFRVLSALAKTIMLTGILSMIFFKIYF